MAGKPKAKGFANSKKDIRLEAFARAYVANGGNQTKAALAAGYAETSAAVRGSELVRNGKVLAMINSLRGELREKFNLTTERVLREVARLAFFNKKKLFDDKGELIPIHKLDDDTAAAIAEVTIEEIRQRVGKSKVEKVVGHTRRVRTFDKNSALDKAMKHLGLYPKEPLLQLNAGELTEEEIDLEEGARRIVFVLEAATRKRPQAPASKPRKHETSKA